jgi:hypothetical protein
MPPDPPGKPTILFQLHLTHSLESPFLDMKKEGGQGMELIQENELIQSLQIMINNYLDKNSSLTINALAGRANVPVTTLRRLSQGQQKNDIAPHSVLNIASYILREKNLQKLMERLEPCVAEFLKKHFGNFIFASESRTFDCDLNNELKDETKYFIYKLAANHNGTDWMTVVENFGGHGKKKVEEMLSKGLLIEADARLHAREKNFSLDLNVAASHLPDLARYYKPDSISRGLNSFFSLSEALNEEAIQEIRTIQREAVKKISAVMNNPECMGEIPFFTLNLSETFTTEQPSGELQ